MALQLELMKRTELRERGAAVVPNAVSRDLVDGALRAINHSLGEGMPVEDIERIRAQTYCRELAGSPVITDLFNASGVRDLCESLLGAGNVWEAAGGQIALRFPLEPGAGPFPLAPHLDGLHTPTNGVPPGELLSFTALVAVLLSDIPEPWSGNFTVWPGSHRRYERYFREHGGDDLLKGCADGMPSIDPGEPEQVTGRAGDIVIAHYLLGHSVAPNLSPNIRYAVFFRVSHPQHEARRWQTLTDLWLEWPGIREAAAPSAVIGR